ncbi:hypothetical protein I553_10841 [Mycobacterium xenopi 4042]|uniref:Uncharacterized protein n=1 Tax=Mycobacterium xenopi 4042 TaxID=1299334 RepID=X8DAZ3_MYCXE|nr:hypothetical protein I553_10841 [Mycobacterium xenopi 4042]
MFSGLCRLLTGTQDEHVGALMVRLCGYEITPPVEVRRVGGVRVSGCSVAVTRRWLCG